MNGKTSLDAPDFLVPKDQQTELEMAEWAAEMAIRNRDVLRKAIAVRDEINSRGAETMAEWRRDVICAPMAIQGDSSAIVGRCRAVLDVLEDGLWHSTGELIGPKVGGSEGLRRLRELRAKGYRIEARKIKGRASWEYRWLR